MMTSQSNTTLGHRYRASVANEIEARWQTKWNEDAVHRVKNPGEAGFDSAKPKFYCLDMFPYPSGAGLHVGHPVGYIGSDILARFKRMNGFNVLHPMGWDAFGLPAEQYAIETGVHPATTTKKAIQTYRKQLHRIGFSFDWSREFATIDPEYYKWTQWIWLRAYNSWFDDRTQQGRPIESLVEALESGEIIPEHGSWESFDAKAKQAFVDGKRLVYLGEQVVNWCPKLGTVLANEEVIDGRSERGGHPVVRRPLKQWMFRITAYADRLLEGLDNLDWPQSTLRMQKEWIGKSEGADIQFPLVGQEDSILVYTTRPDTLFGATFLVLAPEHPLVDSILKNPSDGIDIDEIESYVSEAKNRADVDRMAEQKEKTGVFSGLHVTNPATGKPIPVWIADYVLMGYGHGAIMAVPAHDERDYDFARTFAIPIREVVQSIDSSDEPCFSGDGIAMQSTSEFISIDGLPSADAKQAIIDWLVSSKIGCAKVNYRLRDWLFSRQRYWGEPFPIVFDESGQHYPISEQHLPVELPDLEDYTPTESDDPQPLLAKATDWVTTTAGEAGVDPTLLPPETVVTRETNTMPGWAGSCWYEVRFCSPHDTTRFVDKKAEQYWMGNGIDLYVGGAEHAVLHLLYARFWHKLLYDLGEVSSQEPFQKLFHQGMLTSFAYQRADKSLVPATLVEERDGTYFETESNKEVTQVIAKMSKSLRNVVNPDAVIEEYGADTLRLYEMYMGPLEASAPWNTRDIVGVHRFLQRVWRLAINEEDGVARSELDSKPDANVERALHATVKKVTEDIPKLAHNTAIASMIEFVNVATSEGSITRDQLQTFVTILSPFAPHIAQEIYSKICGSGYVSMQEWPSFNPDLLLEETIEIPVQIMGKVRGRISVPMNANDDVVEQLAIQDEQIKPLLANVTVRKVIIIPNKIINIVAN